MPGVRALAARRQWIGPCEDPPVLQEIPGLGPLAAPDPNEAAGGSPSRQRTFSGADRYQPTGLSGRAGMGGAGGRSIGSFAISFMRRSTA
jgi:hypothetical protein